MVFIRLEKNGFVLFEVNKKYLMLEYFLFLLIYLIYN